jgi:hypothetical protein
MSCIILHPIYTEISSIKEEDNQVHRYQASPSLGPGQFGGTAMIVCSLDQLLILATALVMAGE